MIATSSYVLFDLLDIDGSGLRQHAPACGFEAVMPDCGGEIKSSVATTPTPLPEPLHNLLLIMTLYAALASRSILAASFSISRVIRTRNATRSEFASSTLGGEPAQQPA